MPKIVTSSEAKSRFSELVKWITENQDKVIVKLHGQPTAVIISYTEYEEVEKLREREQKRKVLEALNALRQEAQQQNAELSAEEAYRRAGFSEKIIQETLQADDEFGYQEIMRIIIDTNVFLIYILAPVGQGDVSVVVSACLTLDDIELLLPPEQLVEFSITAAIKRYFPSRIPQSTIDHFVVQLKLLGEMLSPIEEIVSYSRDPKDDYLVAYGVVNEADYLITGDHDLRIETCGNTPNRIA